MRPTAEQAAILLDPVAQIPIPYMPQRVSSRGRQWTPQLSVAVVKQALGLDNAQWNSCRGAARVQSQIYRLGAKKNGNVVPWPDKNAKNKKAAQDALEADFPIMGRCQSRWASEFFLKTHSNYQTNRVWSRMEVADYTDKGSSLVGPIAISAQSYR